MAIGSGKLLEGLKRRSLLSRRFHSGSFNLINKRRRVLPNRGHPRFKNRFSQPNMGMFGIGARHIIGLGANPRAGLGRGKVPFRFGKFRRNTAKKLSDEVRNNLMGFKRGAERGDLTRRVTNDLYRRGFLR